MTKIGTAVQIFSVASRPRTKTTVRISFVSTLWKERLLFRYSLFLLDTNQECCSNILLSKPAKELDCFQISCVSTWKKSGLLFKYPLFLPDTNYDCYSDIVYSYPTYDPNCCLDILYFYLEKIWTAIHISSVSTRPKTRTTIQISSIST